MELLVHLGHLVCKHVVVDLVKDFSEISGAIQFAVLDGTLVAVNHFGDAIHTRIEDVTVESKTMRATLDIGGNCAAETIQIDLLVTVVELQDITHALNSCHVLVPIGVHEMQ